MIDANPSPVIARFIRAIHLAKRDAGKVDAPVKPGHDAVLEGGAR